MRDLLIRLDEKVANGFASIMSRLDHMDRRADGHEKEISDLKVRVLKIETTAVNAQKFAGWIWAACGAGVLSAAGTLAKLVITGSL